MEKQKTNPFRVPEAYFDTFPERLKERIEQMEAEQLPVRRLGRGLGNLRTVLAIAAVVALMALITFPLVRMLTPESGANDNFVEIALLDGAGLFRSDYELARYLEENESEMDDEEAYMSQAIEYLAGTDVEMDLILEY